MGGRVEETDTELRAASSQRAPGHVRLGVPSNLPAELSTFVGRADDLVHGARLVGESRLVTFTGAGGCGKTRLARQVAARVPERFPGGVWWVELASLTDGALVTARVARTLGLQTGETDAVIDYFSDSTALPRWTPGWGGVSGWRGRTPSCLRPVRSRRPRMSGWGCRVTCRPS